MSIAPDFDLIRQVDTMTEAQKTNALNIIIHTAVIQSALGDDTMEQRIRKTIEQEVQK